MTPFCSFNQTILLFSPKRQHKLKFTKFFFWRKLKISERRAKNSLKQFTKTRFKLFHDKKRLLYLA